MLGANPFKSETVAPMDLLVKYPGWQNTHLNLPLVHGERSDVLDAKLPIWISAKIDLYKGEFPFWNHQRGGKPGLTFTNSLFTPAFFTFALVKDNALGFYLSNLVNILIGMIGMYLFLRLFLGTVPSLFGAFIFMFSGFNTAWFYWAHVDTAIWTPWVLYSVYLYISTKKKTYLPWVTLTMLMLNLGGFPMVAVMTYLAVALIILLYFITTKGKHFFSTLFYLITFALLSVIIALPLLYPLVELLSWMGGLKHRSTGAGFNITDLKLFINPDLYRVPRVETTFYTGILPVILLVLSPILLFLRPRLIGFLALFVLLLAMGVAFTWIDSDILKKIPLINSSLFTRFGYLIGVSLAIIAAYVLNEILHRLQKYPRISLLVIVLFFTIQIIDQRHFFHRFNGAVPNASFYPVTKSIDYLQKNLSPHQYVMADSGYLIAGTLGGYGLNDWFAHSFHAGAEKEALRKIVHRPFKTPTSAMFNFSQINLDSPYIDLLNIKAILSTSSIEQSIALWDNNPKAKPSPVLPTHSLVQPFEIDTPTYAEGIQLHLATYGEKHPFSDVILIFKKDNTILEKITVPKERITDNRWVTFGFKNPRTLKVGKYHVTLTLSDPHSPKPLTVWSNQHVTKNPLIVDGKASSLSFHMALVKQRDFGDHYKVHQLEPHISLIENLHVKGDAYYVPTLEKNSTGEYNTVSVKNLSNSEIHIHYSGQKSGWIILPMRHYPGWQISVNHQKVKTKKFLHFLTAIPVAGKSEISLEYSPNYEKYLYILSLFSIFVLLYTIWKFRQKDTPSN